MATTIRIRTAAFDDWPTIADFNDQLAFETENKRLDLTTLQDGVKELLRDETKGRYFVACSSERIVGQIMHTREWSDWRNGEIWWLQSVYVHPDFRRQGVFGGLFNHVNELAKTTAGVIGLRLYVERDNSAARQAYESLGLETTPYHVMERFSS